MYDHSYDLSTNYLTLNCITFFLFFIHDYPQTLSYMLGWHIAPEIHYMKNTTILNIISAEPNNDHKI